MQSLSPSLSPPSPTQGALRPPTSASLPLPPTPAPPRADSSSVTGLLPGGDKADVVTRRMSRLGDDGVVDEWCTKMSPIPPIELMPAFCINLARRKDRWERFVNQPGVPDLPLLRRVDAVDASKTINVYRDTRISTFAKRNIMTKTRTRHAELNSVGAIGCALSHVGVWKWIVANDSPYCLVFEDDAVLPYNFKERANALITRLNNSGGTFYWDLWLLSERWLDAEPSKLHGVTRVYYFELLHAYVITKEYARRLLQEVFPIEGHVDHWMSQYALNNDCTMIGTPELTLIQANSKTDIQTPDQEQQKQQPVASGSTGGKEGYAAEQIARLVRDPKIHNTVHSATVFTVVKNTQTTYYEHFYTLSPVIIALCVICIIAVCGHKSGWRLP